MKKKLLAVAMSAVLVLGLNIAVLGTGSGGPTPPHPISPPICQYCNCLDCCE